MRLRTLLPLAALLLACSGQGDIDAPQQEGDGLAFDEEFPGTDFNPKADMPRQYDVPEWVLNTELVDPEVRVSLDGLSVHLFDKATGLSRVYPTGPGKLGQNSGKSFTPTGFFATSPNSAGSWWNISERFEPSYFGGFPFLRITAHNSKGWNTYGLHGPITFRCNVDVDGPCPLANREWFLVHDFVSHGCMRMRAEDIVELFYLLQGHKSVPVTIQEFTEIDPSGEPISATDEARDWPMDFGDVAPTVYGELGERPSNWDPCEAPEDWSFRSYGC